MAEASVKIRKLPKESERSSPSKLNWIIWIVFRFYFSVLHPGNKKSNTNRTTVKWNTLSPDFHEQFVYMSSITELPKQSLHISVWDKVKGRNDEYMGKIEFQLKQKHRCILVENPGEGWGRWGQGFPEKLPGRFPILSFIAFLWVLHFYSKFFENLSWGPLPYLGIYCIFINKFFESLLEGAVLFPPSPLTPPVCIYEPKPFLRQLMFQYFTIWGRLFFNFNF